MRGRCTCELAVCANGAARESWPLVQPGSEQATAQYQAPVQGLGIPDLDSLMSKAEL